MTRIRDILLPGGPPTAKGPDREAVDLQSQLPLAPPTMWTRGFFIVCAIVGGLALIMLREMSTTLDMSLPWAAWLAPLGAIALVVIIRRIMVPGSKRAIRYGADSVQFPGGRNSRRTFEVNYGDIQAIVPLVSRGQPALVIETPGKTHVFVASDFPHPEHWRILWAQLKDRISRRPDASRQLKEMRRMAELSQNASSVNARFTKYLLYAVAAIFGAQLLFAPDVDVLEFLYFGANSQVMVLQEGQWWRVVTANLLHGNLVHFGVNAFALYFLGTYCERLYGEGRTIVLTLVTALAGASASLIGTEAMFSVGISTALFGLLGAYLALHIRYSQQLPPPYRQSWLWWGVILGLNGVLSFAVPMIDAWGHLGGFAAGVAIGLWMLRGDETFAPRRPSGAWTNLLVAALIALFAASSIIAIGYGLGDHPEDELRFAQAVEQSAETEEPTLLVQLVHQWSQHTPRPAALDPVLVEIAEHGYRRSDDPFNHWRAAAAIVRIAEQSDDPFDRDIMERGIVLFEQFGVRHESRSGRRILAQLLGQYNTELQAFHAAPSPVEEVAVTDGDLVLIPERTVDAPRRIYALVYSEDSDESPKFLLDRCIPAQSSRHVTPHPIDRDVESGWSVELAMIAGADDCPDERTHLWRSTEVVEPEMP